MVDRRRQRGIHESEAADVVDPDYLEWNKEASEQRGGVGAELKEPRYESLNTKVTFN